MKRLISVILLITMSIFINGCAMLSPFKSINSCVTEGDNENCESIESNLEYSISKDMELIEKESVHSDDTVMKSEVVRQLSEYEIDSSKGSKPIMLGPSTYKVFILPYSNGMKYYSGRYVYITAGKPRWISGNYIVSESGKVRIELPNVKIKGSVSKPTKDIKLNKVSNKNTPPLDSNSSNPSLIKPVKHKLSAYLLNCRDLPSVEGNAIAVFEQNMVLDIINKDSNWWQVKFYDVNCFVNSTYLYSEPLR